MTIEWSFLRAIAGALDSRVRRDFPPPVADTRTADLSVVPGVLLVVMQDDAVFYAFGRNRLVALSSNVEMIRLYKGDIIMLRGDFIYFTAGYETNNLVVHAYLDTTSYLRDVERAEPHIVNYSDGVSTVADDPLCYIHNCRRCGSIPIATTLFSLFDVVNEQSGDILAVQTCLQLRS
ncbi:hypothetical protein JG688_00010364 [Phytophthora aleatoria]|uniref:Uncharacterized protein n=1 Tax=Phytophthora aleatoria TaxID=2496075 RepID=A0A8J5MFL1_9STRA|nr:hypothetical protein JG688_00010364 [Phytophthora aleatoria]